MLFIKEVHVLLESNEKYLKDKNKIFYPYKMTIDIYTHNNKHILVLFYANFKIFVIFNLKRSLSILSL